MKKTSILTAVLLALVITPAFAVDELAVWAGGGTDVSTNLCYSVVSANSKNQGSPVLTYLNATSDKAGSVVQFYTAGQPVVANDTNTTVTIPVNVSNSSNYFNANGGIIVIQHKATDTYERRVLTTFTGTTNIVVTVAPTTTVAIGDIIWPMTAAGSIPVGNATLTLGPGDGIYCGQKMKPLLMEIDGTSACQINAAAAKFVP